MTRPEQGMSDDPTAGDAAAPQAVPQETTTVEPAVDEEARPAGRPMSQIDLGVGLFFVALGGFVLWAGRDLGVLTDNSPGPGFLPLGLAIMFITAGGALAVKQFVSPSTGTVSVARAGGTARVLAVFALLAVVVVGLETLGFITSMLILMAGVMFGLERKFTIASVATVILVPVGFWALFAVLLGVRLPEGPLFFYF